MQCQCSASLNANERTALEHWKSAVSHIEWMDNLAGKKKIGDVFISAPASIVTIALRCAHSGQIELHAHYTCCKLQEGNPCNPNENRKEQKTEIQCSFLVPINLKSNFMHQWSIASSTINYVHLLLLYVGVAFSNDGKSSEVDNRTKIERHIGWK